MSTASINSGSRTKFALHGYVGFLIIIIAEVLLGLVHRRSPWPPRRGQPRAKAPIAKLPSLWRRAADVADAVRVIGRLPVPEKMRPIYYLGSLDLR